MSSYDDLICAANKVQGGCEFKKFPNIGDRAAGRFVCLEYSVGKKFGNKQIVITLAQEDGSDLLVALNDTGFYRTRVRKLQGKEGKRAVIVFESVTDTGKGSPSKNYEIYVEP